MCDAWQFRGEQVKQRVRAGELIKALLKLGGRVQGGCCVHAKKKEKKERKREICVVSFGPKKSKKKTTATYTKRELIRERMF